MVRLGMREEVLRAPHLWYCTTCRTCEDRCPQKVPFFRILNVLKNMAAEEGCAPPAWIEQTKQVMRSGRVFPEENSKDHPLMKRMLEASEIARFARDGGSP